MGICATYGRSSGPRDFAGPFSQHAVKAVIDRLKADRRADPDRIAIQGTSLGAVTAALVVADDPTISGLVLVSGLYDLPSFLTEPRSAGAAAVRLSASAQTGGGKRALTQRSAFFRASEIKARTMILNGAKDDRTDPQQAKRFAEAINAAGGHAQFHIYAEFGHEIPFKIREPMAAAFIRSTLHRQ